MDLSKLLYLLMIVVLFSCNNEPTETLCDPTPAFNVDVFKDEILKALDDPANPMVGYQLVISQNGNLKHSITKGVARHARDRGGEVLLEEDTKLNVASVSKFIGTIALLKAMDDNNIGEETLVTNHLPESWKPLINSDFKNFTKDAFLRFTDLLTMNTAINFVGSTPEPGDMLTESQMLTSLGNEPNLMRKGVYQNGNFTLIRVLIGEIVYGLDENADDYATTCTEKYFEYLRDYVFSPSGLTNIPDTPQKVLNYYNTTDYPLAFQYPLSLSFTDPATNGLGWVHSSDPYLNGGSGGLLLSAKDIAQITAYFRYTEDLVSSNIRDVILSNELGLVESFTNTIHGRILRKGGTRGPETCCNRAIRSSIVLFPNNVEVAFVTNSDFRGIETMLNESFENAWVSSCN
ncbi:MAG: serine hydrolase [Jejuia sp.]